MQNPEHQSQLWALGEQSFSLKFPSLVFGKQQSTGRALQRMKLQGAEGKNEYFPVGMCRGNSQNLWSGVSLWSALGREFCSSLSWGEFSGLKLYYSRFRGCPEREGASGWSSPAPGPQQSHMGAVAKRSWSSGSLGDPWTPQKFLGLGIKPAWGNVCMGIFNTILFSLQYYFINILYFCINIV